MTADRSPLGRVLAAVGGPGVVAVFRSGRPDGMLEACEALGDSGIQAVEITLTTPDALRVIASVAAAVGDRVQVGAGTVLDVAGCRSAVSAGASFVVSPGLAVDVVAEARRLGVASLPGALTPTEVMAACRAGADVVKLFPARVADPAYVSDLRGPFPDVRFMPTGGINGDTARELSRRGVFAVGVGGRLVDPAAVRDRDAGAIRAAAAEILSAVAEGRAAR